MVKRAPASATMPAETQPVCAPLSASCTSSAPIDRLGTRSAAPAISVKGTATATSTPGAASAAAAIASSSASAARDPFIFQFPATNLRRVIRPPVLPYQSFYTLNASCLPARLMARHCPLKRGPNLSGTIGHSMLSFFRRIINSKAGVVVTFIVLGVIALAFAAGDITGLAATAPACRAAASPPSAARRSPPPSCASASRPNWPAPASASRR